MLRWCRISSIHTLRRAHRNGTAKPQISPFGRKHPGHLRTHPSSQHSTWKRLSCLHMAVAEKNGAQNGTLMEPWLWRKPRILSFGSIYAGAFWVHFIEPQPHVLSTCLGILSEACERLTTKKPQWQQMAHEHGATKHPNKENGRGTTGGLGCEGHIPGALCGPTSARAPGGFFLGAPGSFQDLRVSKSESQSKPGIKMIDPEPCKEIQRRISATIYGWDGPLLTFIY